MIMVDNQAQINGRILVSALAAEVFQSKTEAALIAELKGQTETYAVEIANAFGNLRLKRQFNLVPAAKALVIEHPQFSGNTVTYQGQVIGYTQLLYKPPIPGELQARLAIESTIDRFLEYLQKLYSIVVLNESNRHVQVFIPNNPDRTIPEFKTLWQQFFKEIAFSANGNKNFNLPGLIDTFILLLRGFTLSGRGFSTLNVPILTKEQAVVLAAWYFAVIQAVKKRQEERDKQIEKLKEELARDNLDEKEREAKLKELRDKEAMQLKEADKYRDLFKKAFGKSLREQEAAYHELAVLESRLTKLGSTKAEQKRLQKQQEKLNAALVFSRESVQQKLKLFQQSSGEPFVFVQLDQQQNPEKFQEIASITNSFNKTATDQINSSRGDIFTQCVTEMYRLLERKEFDPLPEPLLTEQVAASQVRSPGDDSKEFCYSCGVALNSKTVHWQVLRLMFERPSQRRQSSSGEGRPYICASCAALAFASPLKITDQSIVLKIEPAHENAESALKIKDYVRMLTVKELNLSSGRYLMIASEYIGKGEKKVYASDKLGQVQYVLAKVASIFPVEVLTDFNFLLIVQGGQPVYLTNRHLIYIKGLMDGYNQTIKQRNQDQEKQDKNQNEEINMDLGDAVRYLEQDLPFLAQYKLAKVSKFANQIVLEESHAKYYKQFQEEAGMMKRTRLYRDVAALTGLMYPFADSIEWTIKDFLKKEKEKYPEKYTDEKIRKEVEREVCKLIEEVHSATSFCYYATKGDDRKTSVQAKLKRDPANHFVYERVKELLEQELKLQGREDKDALTLYADDILKAYDYFAQEYSEDKDWKELTYNLKLSLYTRFPEFVRKLKSKGDE